jgi:hypothetical protein
LIKQRLARPGQGKSGGLRTIVVFRKGNRAIFIDIFAKKDKANLTEDELKGYRKRRAYCSVGVTSRYRKRWQRAH